MARRILVTGATGKQGSSVINALLANPPPFEHEILALTRNAGSAGAKKIAEKSPKVTLLTGDFNDCPAIFAKAGRPGSVWGVFSVQLPAMVQPRGSPKDIEQQQGFALIDAALAAGVSHFVYTSVDRGGDADSFTTPTDIPHFVSKYRIEHHLVDAISAATTTKMTYTILRPVAFFENLTPDFIGKGFSAMWKQLPPKAPPLQLVATRDIGIFAAQAFSQIGSSTTTVPETYRNTVISLAGDALSHEDADKVFRSAFAGRPMPTTFGLVATLLRTMFVELGSMFTWFGEVGYGADIERCRALNPRMQNFEAWLKEESGFR
jgi:uncharacterized protein YbjT (DUF2867 family)